MRKVLLVFIIMIMYASMVAGQGWYNAAAATNTSENVSALANLTVNATLKAMNATQKLANETSHALSAIRAKFRDKETINWTLLDKTHFSEFYVPAANQSFFVSIISKHENSKIAIAYSENTRFLYENVYLTIINRNQSNLTLRFITDQDAKTFETNKEFTMMKIHFSDEVHRLSFYVLDGNTTLFSFENITILHRTYESYVIEESKEKVTIDKSKYFGIQFGYMLTGMFLAFGSSVFWIRRKKKQKEDTIWGGW